MVEVERATQDELRQDLKSLFQGAIRLTLEMVLEEELKAMVGARRFERVGSRKGHRNGTYLRRLLTSLGQIDVTVPRSREGGSPADVMGRYQRRSEEVDAMMVEAYVSGVSQRKMGDVTEALMGERVGRSTVSRVRCLSLVSWTRGAGRGSCPPEGQGTRFRTVECQLTTMETSSIYHPELVPRELLPSMLKWMRTVFPP